MCVCFGDPCAQNFKLRDNFERLLCWLDHWLSCMLNCIHDCVFLLSKNWFLKVAQHLLDTLLSIELFKPFSYRNPDSSSIPGGSIENAPTSSIASRHLVDQSSFYSWIWFLVAWYLLDTSAVDKHFLDTYLDSFLDTSFVEIYWVFYLSLLVQSEPHFTRYLSRLLSIFSPKLSHLTPILILKGFFKLFQDFLLLVSL